VTTNTEHRIRQSARLASPGAEPDQHSQTVQGLILVAMGAMGFSSIIVFARLIQGMSALSIAFYRATFSFSFFTALLVITRQHQAFHPSSYRRAVPYLIGLGVSVGITGILYVFAAQHTTAAAATLLNNTSAVYVTLLAPWLLGEPRRPYAWLSLALAMAGMLCLAGPAELALFTSSVRGTAAAALSGLSYAAMMLLGRAVRGQVDTMVQIWWSMGIAALMAVPWAGGISRATLISNLPYLAGLGIFAQGIPYTLYFLGLRRAPAQLVSITALLEPAAGIMLGVLFFREIPGILGLAGILMIAAAIALASISAGPAPAAKSRLSAKSMGAQQ